ncbi:hypothetical protein BZG36_02932 [Bifiguratus adelaidae]|uniref:C2 domain-containing protein n=1 Tax=Bifiguratus adelaidae TaxID=1938954 RepID=A0A261Y007_9FUNG|nr:hypothetical protein BZG36_02932 [Bifiguratus adelaidae]
MEKGPSTLRRNRGRTARDSQRVDPIAVYDYTLRCAVLAAQEELKSKMTDTTPPGTDGSGRRAATPGGERVEKHSSTTLHDTLGGLAEMFSDSDKQDKLNRDVVKGLLRRIDDVLSRRDVSNHVYADPHFLAAVRSFRSPLDAQKAKPSGKINDLIVIFVQTSKIELTRAFPPPATISEHLNAHVAAFTELLKVTLTHDAPGAASPETIERLAGLSAPTKRASSGGSRSRDTPSYQTHSRSGSLPVNRMNAMLEGVESHPLVKGVAELFQMDPNVHTRKVRELMALCTDANLMKDLMKLKSNVHTQAAFPASPNDFPTAQAYETWKARELGNLKGMIAMLTLSNPNLVTDMEATSVGSANLLGGSAASRPSSLYGSGPPSPRHASMEDGLSSVAFTFIPPDPKSYYRILLSMCIDFDLTVRPQSERSKSSILTPLSESILKETHVRWRIGLPFREVLYLELIRQHWESGGVVLDEVKHALQRLVKGFKEVSVDEWATQDTALLVRILHSVFNTTTRELRSDLEEYFRINPEIIHDKLDLLEKICDIPVFQQENLDLDRTYEDLEMAVEGAAVLRWTDIDAVASQEGGKGGLARVTALADKLVKELTMILKRFPEPIGGHVSVISIVLGKQMPYFALEMENWAMSADARMVAVEDVFVLYHKVLRLRSLYAKYGPSGKRVVNFKMESWFLFHVRTMLRTMESSCPDWVTNAVKQDEFAIISGNVDYSSSVMDLFTALHQNLDFIRDLHWPNEVQNAYFLTALSKIVAKAMDQYSAAMEACFNEDISPKPVHPQQAQPNMFGSALSGATLGGVSNAFNRARSQWIGDVSSKRELSKPFHFTSEMCVKLNNIEEARHRIDKIYQYLDVELVAEIVREFSGQQPVEKSPTMRYTYSIKIVRAENLKPMDQNGFSDPYVVLEFNEETIARTKTVYETLNPRWDENFDVSLNAEKGSLLAIVMDEDLVGADDDCGACQIKLAPSLYQDYQAHDEWLDLDTQGRLLVRISMEGEKDDIQFWFGKAFRALKRAEDDMIAAIAHKMSGYIKTCLSPKVISTLLGRDRKITDLFRTPSQKATDVDIRECERALGPLLDYFDKNLKLLNDNLREPIMQQLLLKIWTDILVILEDDLLPPLSDQPSSMKPLDSYELLKVYFNGGEDGDAVPIDQLETPKYYELLAINHAYNNDVQALIDDYDTVTKTHVEAANTRGGRGPDRSKSVYRSKNLNATIKRTRPERKVQKSHNLPSAEAILRLLRLRQGKAAKDFLKEQMHKRNLATSTQLAMQETPDEVPPVPLLPNLKSPVLYPPLRE